MSEENVTYIDATGLVLGRLSSWIAQRILRGENVVVVNTQDMIISGRRKYLIEDYLQKRSRATHTNPKRGPFFPRFPDRILRRTVRGMLPWKTRSAKTAFRRLSSFIEIPKELAEQEFQSVPEAKRTPSNRYMTVGELARSIGWQHNLEN
ncbi:MAG: 50S ribosomal protein L13 [Candidatus Kariarchaeaceae archaeon]